MKKILAKPKSMRHRYKRYAAVLAGAAIMAGSTLPSMSAKVEAAEAPDTSPPITTEQTAINTNTPENLVKEFTAYKTKSIKKLRNGWHEHIGSWPSSGDNQGWYENGRIFYRNATDRPTEYNNTSSIPVDFVKEYASLYGFDPANDAFTLLSSSNREATVQVVKHDTGQRFKVDLENYHGWRIVAVRGIGDMTHPATYRSYTP